MLSLPDMPVKTGVPSRVVVHPIVLLSVVDHFNRLSRIGNQRRVVGVLLGSWRKGNVVDVATSFAGEVGEGGGWNLVYAVVVSYSGGHRSPRGKWCGGIDNEGEGKNEVVRE